MLVLPGDIAEAEVPVIQFQAAVSDDDGLPIWVWFSV